MKLNEFMINSFISRYSSNTDFQTSLFNPLYTRAEDIGAIRNIIYIALSLLKLDDLKYFPKL